MPEVPEDTADARLEALLRAALMRDTTRLIGLLEEDPALVGRSLHAAAIAGEVDAVRRLARERPESIHEKLGEVPADPLLYLCHSPLHGQSDERDRALVESARILLEAGADPNTTDGQYGVPALYAVTGLQSVLPIARMLLAAGADPNDGESLFHAAEHFHEDALDLLIASGADVNHSGEWGNSPLYFLLIGWQVAQHESVRKGFDWLLAHGADPNVRCGSLRETALHAAVRRHQGVDIVSALLDHGADVEARRADGATPWRLAYRAGDAGMIPALEARGAKPESVSVTDRLLAACARGDAEAARRSATAAALAALSDQDRMMISEAVVMGRHDQVEACLAAGFDPDARNERGATALHEAAIRGDFVTTSRLLRAGADHSIRDPEHSSTPLGWASFGADFVLTPGGDYPATVRALVESGARPRPDEHQPENAAVRAILS